MKVAFQSRLQWDCKMKIGSQKVPGDVSRKGASCKTPECFQILSFPTTERCKYQALLSPSPSPKGNVQIFI